MEQPRIAILTQPPLASWTDSVVMALSAKGARPLIVESPDQLSGLGWDAGWLRVVPETESADIPDYWRAAERLEADGVPLLNSIRSHLNAYNKVLAGELFARAGLPTPQTWQLDDCPKDLPSRLICKPVTTSQGFGITEVAGWQQALDHQHKLGIPCLLQERIDTARCIRVVCTPQKTIRAYEKHVEPGSLVASVALGATMIDLEPSQEMCHLAQAMVGLVGGNMMGVDLLQGRDGKLWALEVNASFGFDPEDQLIATGVADEILKAAKKLVPSGS